MTAIFNALKEITILSAIMIIVTLALKKYIGKWMDSKVSVLLWTLILFRLLLPITLNSPVHISDIQSESLLQHNKTTYTQNYTNSNTSNYTMINEPLDFTPTVKTSEVEILNNNNTITNNTIKSNSKHLLNRIKKIDTRWYVVLIWAVGFIIVTIKRLIIYYNFKRILCYSKTNEIDNLLSACKQKLDINRNIKIVKSDYLTTPITCGIFRPTIAFPKSVLNNLSEGQLKIILLHELIHVKKKDVLFNYLWMIAKTIHWYNPLIYIAYNKYLLDVELSCDKDVIKSIEVNEIYTYTQSLLDVIKLSKKSAYAPCGLSFCSNKNKLRKRVQEMIKPTKKLKSAMYLSFILAIIMIIGCFTTACQPTPDEVIVGSKNESIVEQVIETNQENPEILQDSKEVIKEQIESINEHINMEFNPNESTKVVVDAEVFIPSYDKIPLVRVVPENLTQEHLEILIEQLCGDEPVYYEPDGISIWSKEEIAGLIISLKEMAENPNLESHIKNHLDDRIENMQNRYYSISPTIDDLKLYDGTIPVLEDSSVYSHLASLKCYLGRNVSARISLCKSFSKKQTGLNFNNQDEGYVYNTYITYEGVDSPKIDITFDEARQKAIDLIKALDGEYSNLALYDESIVYCTGGFSGSNEQTSPQAYSFSFARKYNDAIVKPVMYLYGDMGEYVNYIQQVQTESIQVVIDNYGVTKFSWKNYTEYEETVTEDVALLDFETIQQTFVDYMGYKFMWTPNFDNLPQDTTSTITIHSVELNLMMTPEKDNKDNYIMIPVWDFIGDMEYDQELIAEDGYPEVGQRNAAILTINAIDGTVIDRKQGY